jgi:hypothetical protein
MSEIPLHRFNQPQTKVWLLGGVLRAMLVNHLRQHYPGGCGVLSATNYHIAFVLPNGNVRELAPPYRRYPMWMIANRPAPPICQCAEFFDPESGRPWKLRARDGEHHPVCQFSRSSGEVFNRIERAHLEGQKMRPDEWIRMRERAEGTRDEKRRL